MEVLDSNTLIPLGFIITMAAGLIGLVRWLTTIHQTTKQNTEDISELKKQSIPNIHSKLDEVQRNTNDVKQTVSKIEGQLDFLVDHAKAHQ